MQRAVKIVLNGEIRRIPLCDDATLDSLRKTCAAMFSLKNSNFQLCYVDEEGDKINLSAIEELRTLIDVAGGVFKLTLEKPVAKPKVVLPLAPLGKAVVEEEKKVVVPEKVVEETPPVPKTIQEKRKAFKKNTALTKIVRLRWKEIQEGAPAKGCFVGATFKAKVHLRAARGNKSVWFLHETNDGDVVLAPLSANLRHLRVTKNNKINLNKGGAGDRARWSLLRNGEKISLAELNHQDNLQFVSKFNPDLILSVGTFFNKKNNIKMGVTTAPKAAAIEGNVLATTFGIEVVDPAKMLIKVIKNIKFRKQLMRDAYKHKKNSRRGGPFINSQDFAALVENKEKPYCEDKEKMRKKLEKRLKKMEKKRFNFCQL